VDTITYNEMKDIEERGKIAIQEGRFVDAFVVCTTVHALQLNVSDSMSVVFLCRPPNSLRIYTPPVPNSMDLFEPSRPPLEPHLSRRKFHTIVSKINFNIILLTTPTCCNRSLPMKAFCQHFACAW
jgi:hypothetical protein